MNYVSENENSFDFSVSVISHGEQKDGILILYINNAIVTKENSRNDKGKDMFVPEMAVNIWNYTILSGEYMQRKILSVSNNSVRTFKTRALYKSELSELANRLSEGDCDIFKLNITPTEKIQLSMELLFNKGTGEDSLVKAEITCEKFTAEWENYGAERKPPKLTFKEKARLIKRDVPAVFLAMTHKDTPIPAKLTAALAVGYALSPIDLIPDFIPFLGYLDDVFTLSGLVLLAVKLIPKNVMEECRKKSEGMWKNGKPKKWYYAIPIVLLWLIILTLIIRALM